MYEKETHEKNQMKEDYEEQISSCPCGQEGQWYPGVP